jgi:hypothetical protein
MRRRTIACAFVCLACSPAFAQPVLRYTFDEASGNAIDTGSGVATDGTLQGGATRSADTPSGSGMSLDLRTDDPIAFVEAPDTSDFDGMTAFTLTTWLKVEAYPSNPSNNKRLIAKQSGGATFPGFSFNMNAAPNDGDVGPDNFRLGLFVGSADAFDFAFSDVDAGAAEWTFIASTYDSAVGEIKFYTGGVNTPVTQLGNTMFTALNPTPIDGADARFAVGLTDAAATADTSVTGWQDDVRVYNSALDLAALEAVRMENLGGGGGSPADFNNDGDVDGADLTAWRMGFGTTGTAAKADGDADADMDVDGADFLIWQQELGPAGGVTSIPEPAAGVLLLFAATVGAAIRRL